MSPAGAAARRSAAASPAAAASRGGAPPLPPLEKVEKLVIFAHHAEVLDQLAHACLARGVRFIRIDGVTDVKQKHAFCSEFARNPAVQVALLSITAAGTGLSFIAAHTCVFAEISWVPSDMLQAEDRVHRIGQTRAPHIHYCLAPATPGDFDRILFDAVSRKMVVIAAAIESGSGGGGGGGGEGEGEEEEGAAAGQRRAAGAAAELLPPGAVTLLDCEEDAAAPDAAPGAAAAAPSPRVQSTLLAHLAPVGGGAARAGAGAGAGAGSSAADDDEALMALLDEHDQQRASSSSSSAAGGVVAAAAAAPAAGGAGGAGGLSDQELDAMLDAVEAANTKKA